MALSQALSGPGFTRGSSLFPISTSSHALVAGLTVLGRPRKPIIVNPTVADAIEGSQAHEFDAGWRVRDR